MDVLLGNEHFLQLKSFLNISLQSLHILFEGRNTFFSDLTNRQGVIIPELFCNLYVLRLFQLLDLYTEVAGRGTGFFFYENEFGFLYTN